MFPGKQKQKKHLTILHFFLCVHEYCLFVSGCFNGVARMESSGIKTFLPNNKFGGNIKKVGQNYIVKIPHSIKFKHSIWATVTHAVTQTHNSLTQTHTH